MSDNDFKNENRGKSLPEIAIAHMNRLIDAGADPDVVKRAMILVESAKLSEKLLVTNKPGEANVLFSASLIAGLMSEISPAHLLIHFYETLKDALFLRRIHDAHFDEVLTELEQTNMVFESDEKVH